MCRFRKGAVGTWRDWTVHCDWRLGDLHRSVADIQKVKGLFKSYLASCLVVDLGSNPRCVDSPLWPSEPLGAAAQWASLARRLCLATAAESEALHPRAPPSPGPAGCTGHVLLVGYGGAADQVVTQASQRLGTEPVHCHICLIFLIQASHVTKPNFRGEH